MRSGSQRTTLWGSLVAGYAHPILHHASLKEAPNNVKEAFVADPARDSGHQDIVIDPVEKFLQIKIGDNAITRGDVLLCLGYCLMGGATWTESVAMLGKRRVPLAL